MVAVQSTRSVTPRTRREGAQGARETEREREDDAEGEMGGEREYSQRRGLTRVLLVAAREETPGTQRGPA